MRLLRRRPTVLMYHGFRTDPTAHDPYDLAVLDTAFAAQLDHLRSRGWATLDLDGYLAALRSGGRPYRSCLVTIDDALRSVLDLGAPLLAGRGIPAVLFTPPGLLGGTTSWLERQPDMPILTAAELREVATMGVEIGVHGWDHTTMLGMSDDALRRNAVDARDAVGDCTGVVPRAFAYPFGDYDDRAIAAVAAAGFEVAFSVYDDRGPHAISRTDVKPGDSLPALRLKLACGARYRQVWRAVGALGPVRQRLRKSAQRL